MNIINQGLVYRGATGSDTQSAIFPALCITDTGRWWCAFRSAPEKVANVGQQVLLTHSDDEGATWSPPIAPFIPPVIDDKPGSFRTGGLCDLGNGKLCCTLAWVDYSHPKTPYFNETTEGLLDTRIYVANSSDHGESWSALRLVDTTPYNVPTPLTGPPIALASGTVACQFELNKHYEDQSPWRHRSVLLFSEDQGATWTRHTVPHQDPDNEIFYWDQRVSQLPDGRLFEVFWTFDRPSADYLNIHATLSEDEGRTWSAPWDTGVPGQPGPLFALADGSLCMPVVDRSGAPKITVRQSHDGGRTWPEEDTLLLYDSVGASQTESKTSMQDAWAEMYAFSVGLPHTAPLAGGGAVVTYYAGDQTDSTAIHFAVVN